MFENPRPDARLSAFGPAGDFTHHNHPSGKYLFISEGPRSVDVPLSSHRQCGDTVEFRFSEHRDLLAAKRFLRKVLERHGRPDRIVIDGSQTNREAITSCDAESRLRDKSQRALKPIRIRKSQYLNNRIEQDYRRIKRRVRSMLGFKSFATAAATLAVNRR